MSHASLASGSPHSASDESPSTSFSFKNSHRVQTITNTRREDSSAASWKFPTTLVSSSSYTSGSGRTPDLPTLGLGLVRSSIHFDHITSLSCSRPPYHPPHWLNNLGCLTSSPHLPYLLVTLARRFHLMMITPPSSHPQPITRSPDLLSRRTALLGLLTTPH